MAVDREHAMKRKCLHECVGLALEREEDGLAVALELADAGYPCKSCGKRQLVERHGDASEGVRAQLLDAGEQYQASFANESDAVGDVLYLRQDMGGEEDRRPCRFDFRDERVERLLDQGVETDGRLV